MPRAAWVAAVVALAACGSTTRRITPGPPAAYPPGVGGPVESAVIYPAGTSRRAALRDYLRRGVERSAGWVSHLELTALSEPRCAMRLLPGSVQQQYDATYLTTGHDLRGNEEYDVETRREQVMIPFVRALDDLDAVLRDADVWVSSQPAPCAVSTAAPLEIRGFIHGRVPIGVRRGPGHLDLRRCDPDGLNVVTLGTADAVAAASAVLPGWTGARVRLTLPDGPPIEGTLARYYLGNLTIVKDDGGQVHVHVVDARVIRRLVPASSAPTAAPPSECAGWPAGDGRL